MTCIIVHAGKRTWCAPADHVYPTSRGLVIERAGRLQPNPLPLPLGCIVECYDSERSCLECKKHETIHLPPYLVE